MQSSRTLRTLRHVPFEGPAHIATWAAARGYALATTRLFAGDDLPDTADLDGLVVMGGPMNIYEEDRYSWLVDEKALIREAIEAGKPVVGVCLGAQLIADVLGSRVVPVGQKEIGWFPLHLTDAGQAHPLLAGVPASLPVFHWHGETFALPNGAVHLARTPVCETQAFLWGDHVLGLQCHFEMTRSSVDAIIEGCADELAAAQGQPWVQSVEAMHAVDAVTVQHAHAALEVMLDQLFILQ
ncbi:MAG: gamma-glutamyl-gamma-aminobutyrate hydrolase family protein [Bacteroidota bacterium]